MFWELHGLYVPYHYKYDFLNRRGICGPHQITGCVKKNHYSECLIAIS